MLLTFSNVSARDVAVADRHPDRLSGRRDTHALANSPQVILHCTLGKAQRCCNLDLPPAGEQRALIRR